MAAAPAAPPIIPSPAQHCVVVAGAGGFIRAKLLELSARTGPDLALSRCSQILARTVMAMIGFSSAPGYVSARRSCAAADGGDDRLTTVPSTVSPADGDSRAPAAVPPPPPPPGAGQLS